MAAIASAEAIDTTGGTYGVDTNYSTVLTLAAGSMVAGAKYLVLAQMNVGGGNVANQYGARLVHGGSDTVFLGSELITEAHGTVGDLHHMTYMTVWTQPGSAEDIKLQVKTNNASNPVSWDTANIVVIRLDDDLTENTDYWFNEDDDSGAPTALTTTEAPFANVTFTPAAEDYLVIGHIQIACNNVAISHRVRLNRDDTDLAPLYLWEGETTNDNLTSMILRAYTLSASSQNIAIEAEDDGSGTQSDHVSSRLFILRLSAFEDHMSPSWNEAEVAPSKDTWSELATASVTPSTTGDWLLLGFAAYDAGGSGRTGYLRITDDAVAIVAGSDNLSNGACKSYDSTCENPMCRFGVVELSSAGANTLDMDGTTSSNSGGVLEDRAFAGFSLELAAGAAVERAGRAYQVGDDLAMRHFAAKRGW
jgi:hypothetical protein